MNKAIAWAVVVIAGAVFAVTLARATLFSPQESEIEVPPPAIVANAAPGDYPARLRIPTLSINAKVQNVGLGKSGAMAVPTNYTDVGWYKLGPLPGQQGSAVMDGHVDNGFALPGVFKYLGNIKVGDEIFVDTKDGRSLRFVVTEIEAYPYKEAPTQKIFARNDRPRLNLITCQGSWVKADKTYDQRLVVFAELKE